MSAVNACNDSITNPITIFVMPGIYLESVDIAGRYISIVGYDKNTCILRNNSGAYATPPLNMSGGNNNISNMTIISTHDDGGTPSPSYAIHCDSEGVGTSEIFNCSLISKQHAGIGIGLHDQQTLILNNCEIYKNDTTRPYNGGSIYMHNQQPNGATNQKFIVKNCNIKSDTGYALVIEDANHRAGGGYGDTRDTTISFYNNILWSIALEKVNIVGGDAPLGTGYTWGYIKLTKDSYGNNLSALNA